MSCNCTNCEMKKNILEQALVGNVSLTVKSDGHEMIEKQEMNNPVHRTLDSLLRKRRRSSKRRVRWRLSWRVSQTQTLRREMAKDFGSCCCTS